MRDVIRKILKEEELDWIKNANPEEEIIEFVEKRVKKLYPYQNYSGRKLGELFYWMRSAMHLLITDTQEMSQYAENANDDTWDFSERLNSLYMIKDYSNMNRIINDCIKTLEFFRPLLEQKNYNLDDILNTLIKHYTT